MTGKNLKKLRNSHGLTQTDLAQRMGYKGYLEVLRLEKLLRIPDEAMLRLFRTGLITCEELKKRLGYRDVRGSESTDQSYENPLDAKRAAFAAIMRQQPEREE